MKMMNKLRVGFMILCFAGLLGACGTQEDKPEEPEETTDATYSVTVVDALGKPYTTGVIVRYMQNGEQVAMQAVDAQGVAKKTLPKGDYTVELMFTDSEASYYYDKTDLTLSATKCELQVELSRTLGNEAQTIFAPTSATGESKECTAYLVTTGGTYVTLSEEGRTYFLFKPTEAGTYEFSVKGESVQIGYYGSPHFVQALNVADVTDNKFTLSISASMIGTGDAGTSVYVIGVETAGAKDCILTIERTGNAAHTIEDEPWMIYKTTATLSKFTLGADAKISEFDLTASTDRYNLVYNETDGFYHLDSAEGPLVLVRLSVDSKYLACFKNILDRSGVSRYFYKEGGSFDKKESYSECLLEYIEYADETHGVYPLTEDLKYIIQQRGDYVGWWNVDSSGYLFLDEAGNPIPGINADIAWLLMCCYVAE